MTPGELRRPWWMHVLLPDTDRTIAVQAVIAISVSAFALRASWSRPWLRPVTVGLVMIVAGLFGLRASH